jgi:outer membrane immunogenic protein
MMMTKFLLRISLAAAALASVSAAAIAADMLPPPPPPPEMRPATYDWSGPYVGGFVSIVSEEGHYDIFPDCPVVPPPGGCPPRDPEMSGSGFAGGVLAGWNYDMDGFVMGIEGDWGWGGKIAQNREPAELTTLDLDNIATIRARAGVAFDDTLIYITGGAAFAELTFGGEVGPAGGSVHDEDSDWVSGWTIGGGIEHAFTDSLHGRLEYLFVDLDDSNFRLQDPAGFGGSLTQHVDEIHMVRAAVTWNFSI